MVAVQKCLFFCTDIKFLHALTTCPWHYRISLSEICRRIFHFVVFCAIRICSVLETGLSNFYRQTLLPSSETKQVARKVVN